MANIKKSITELVGHTPLLEVSRLEELENLKAKVIIKLELFNPNQSSKDRIALQIIENAEKEGKLKPGATIVETSSGNTGIGIAGIAAAKGYKFKAYLQDQVSIERYQVIEALGGEAVALSTVPEVKKVMDEENGDFIAAFQALKRALRDRTDVFFADQCYNYANIEAHERTTGVEIWDDTDGKVDILITTVGTGGTISGVGKYLKKQNPNVKIIAIEPGPASIRSEENPHPEEIMGVHPFTNIPEKNIPKTLDQSVIDEVVALETEQAYEGARKLARYEGILVGTSSGAAYYYAEKLAKLDENKGKQIVVIAPDTGLRYLSTNLYGERNVSE